MGELGIYDLEDVSYSVALGDIEATEAEYYVVSSEEYNRKFVPQSIVPKIEGTRQVDLGYMGSGEWVLLKSGTEGLEETGASNIGAQAVLEETELSFPKMDYSEGQLIIEHVGDLKSPISALNQDTERYDDLIEAVAGKVVLGDNDLGGNIGFVDGKFYLYDFDRAGSTIRGTEESVYEYMRHIDRLTEVEPRIEDVKTAMKDLAWSFDVVQLEDRIDFLLGSVDQRAQRKCMRIEAEDFISNITYAREGEFFNTELINITDSTYEEDVEGSDDILKQNIQKVMLG